MMDTYKHILLAVDFRAKGINKTIGHAVDLAREHGAKLTILHVIEHINAYGVAQAYPTIADLEEQVADEAKQDLSNLLTEIDLQGVDSMVESGSPKVVIIESAKKIGSDLIVLGSHGRHGIGLLLGSTANAVLHHAPCDVLAVRINGT